MRRSCSPPSRGASESAATKGSRPVSCSSVGDIEDSCVWKNFLARAAGGGVARTLSHARRKYARVQTSKSGPSIIKRARPLRQAPQNQKGKGEGIKVGLGRDLFFQTIMHARPRVPLPFTRSPFPFLLPPFKRGGDAVLKHEVGRVVFELEEVRGRREERGLRDESDDLAGDDLDARSFGLAPPGL